MAIGCIYKITNRLNGKAYIGQTVQNVKDRWYRHCRKRNLSENEMNMYIKRAILKYGRETFEFEVLEECDEDYLDAREISYISYYDSFNRGYNLTPGGSNGGRRLKTSEEDQNKMVDLYNYGFSLRELSREYDVDKATVKSILVKHNVQLREVRSYKYSHETRQEIVTLALQGTSRKEIMNQYHIGKGYLSQLLSGQRRI